MSQSWLVGSKPDCDLVVNLPQVSGHHCRLTREDGSSAYVLEDVGSTNGTYVNGVRVTTKVRVAPNDTITLGQLTPMPWPTEPAPRLPARVVRIGRLPDNDYVVDLPMVSGHHARIVWETQGGQPFLEDLGSANGTALGSLDRKISRSVLSPGDTIFLGSHSISAAEILSPSAPAPEIPEKIVTVPETLAKPSGTALAEEIGRALGPRWRILALLTQAPLAGLTIVMLGNFHTRALALFCLGLAAIWFGLSNAVIGTTLGPSRPQNDRKPNDGVVLVSRFLALGSLGAIQCVLMWIIAAYGTGLQGPGVPTLSLLYLASTVGLALGLLLVALAPRRAFAWALLPLALVPLWLFGGGPKSLPQMESWTQTIATALPSRWAFEGLLLIESEPSVKSGAKPRETLAEAFFPARTERMGLKADGIALAAMGLGLSAATAFISLASKPARAL